MTKDQTITKFELFMDDQTDLSDQEESDLFDKIFNEVVTDRPWEFAKKSFTGTVPSSGTTVSLPADFLWPVENHNHTQDSYQAHGPVVFVINGNSYDPWKVVSWSDRRQYVGMSNVVYIDIPNAKLVFSSIPSNVAGLSFEMDYFSLMPALTGSQSAPWPSAWHDVIYHYMCVDEFILSQSDKAKSYAAENKARGDSFLAKMQHWNANLVQLV